MLLYSFDKLIDLLYFQYIMYEREIRVECFKKNIDKNYNFLCGF